MLSLQLLYSQRFSNRTIDIGHNQLIVFFTVRTFNMRVQSWVCDVVSFDELTNSTHPRTECMCGWRCTGWLWKSLFLVLPLDFQSNYDVSILNLSWVAFYVQFV